MKTRLLSILTMTCVLLLTAQADGKQQVKKYFADTAKKVNATENVVEKRQILENSFSKMTRALDVVAGSASISDADRVGIDRFKASLQEKRDELAGTNGFERVSDSQLNSYSQYVVQDMEQAEVVSISLVTLLLILILVVLLV